MLRSLLRKKPANRFKEYVVDSRAALDEMHYWGEEQCLPRMLVPVEWIRTGGAWRATDPGHPFRIALSGEKSDLAEFFDRFQPANLREFYRLPGSGSGDSLEPSVVPWLRREHRRRAGEGNLDTSHGTSLYGPCTGELVDLEFHRLQKVSQSIQAHGYDPDRYGDINGQFLTKGDQIVFFVRGGKHRAVTLAHLGYDRIPVVFRQGWPRVVDVADADHFPRVLDGEISAAGVAELMAANFEDRV